MFSITSDIVVSGFVSKVVNDCVDVLKSKIKDADKGRESDSQNFETRIYQVTIDALNEFTKDKYKGQDILYDAAESILNGLKNYKGYYLEAVKTGLRMLAVDNMCEDFLGILCYEICKRENRDLAIEIIIFQQEQTSGYVNRGFNKSYQIEKEINEKLDYLIEVLIGKAKYERQNNNEIYIKSRAEEYADKWNSNVFLNDFNEEDDNAGVNIKLSEIYIEKCLPHYIWKTNKQSKDTLRNLLVKYTINVNEKKMLLILGQPGIGKSTLITWIMANLVENMEQILVYQFASDLKNINWQGDDILNDILNTLKLSYDGLESKVLILDGFDEIHASSDCESILNQLYHKLKEMNYLKHFSLIITCRKNYVYELQKIKCDYITLQEWEDEQIKIFCEIYGSVNKSKISQNTLDKLLLNKKVFGVPLILYMVLALDIFIKENDSIADVYDQIFSLDGGGIYDRCIKNISYAPPHRISTIKQQIHQFSQRMAFWIFENNSEKAFISQMEYEKICDTVIEKMEEKNEDLKRDVFIGNYFERIRHCEGIGTDELHYIHCTIYEYFVAVHFYDSIHNLADEKEIAGKLGELLKIGKLSKQILEFIEYKFDRMEAIKEVFQMMLRDGMTYYMKVPCKNVIKCEMNIFSNMLEVVHLKDFEREKFDDKIIFYLQYNKQEELNLEGIELRNVDLSNVYLKRANLSRANLEGTNLKGANLSGANLELVNLKSANLVGADLGGADLKLANLELAYLEQTNLAGTDLEYVHLKQANSEGVFLEWGDSVEENLVETNLKEANLEGAHYKKRVFRRGKFRRNIFERDIFSRSMISFNIFNFEIFIFTRK